jgi:hypothetical protein
VASISGSNFSAWYRQDEGTVFAEFAKGNNAASGRIFTISNATSSNQIRLNGSLSTFVRPDWQVLDATVVQANITDAPQGSAGSAIKSAGGYALNSFGLATAGALGTTDTSGTVPAVSQLNVGANEASFQLLNGTIRRLTYWPTRLSNSTLQSITQ